MRTIWRWVSLVWLVLIGVVFALPFPPIMRNPYRWEGATLGWSPIASVGAVEGSAGVSSGDTPVGPAFSATARGMAQISWFGYIPRTSL